MPISEPPDRDRSLAIPLIAMAAACLLAVMFLHLGSEVREGETRALDGYVVQTARELRLAQPWMADAMRDLSGLGSTIVLTLLTIGSCGYLALTSARMTAVIVAISICTGALGVELLKSMFGRLRPDSVLAHFVAPGLSFPSGHSSMAAVVFLTLGALLARIHERRSERVYIMAAATLFTLLIGISRAALGVHWATDVLGGWAFGTSWATLWLLVAHEFDRRRKG